MEQKIHLSPETTLALQQLKSVLDSRHLSLEQLLALKNIHSNQLERKDFITFISEFTQMKPQHIFKQLRQLGGKKHVLSVSDLIMILHKLEKTSSTHHEIHPSKKLKKREMNKNQIQTVILKLKQYLIRLPNSMNFLLQFDINRNGSIDKFEFNNMLMATGIRYFHNKKIRRQVVECIFKQFGKFEISFSELCHQFGIKENAKIQKEQKNSTLAPQNNTKQPYKPQLPQIPILETQESDIADIKKEYPLSIQYYNRGQFYQYQVLEQLQQLLKNNIKFIDNQRPKIQQGAYESAANILKGEYHIFQFLAKLSLPQSRLQIVSQLQPKNVIQGKINDCYFMSSIASIITKHPGFIIQKFLVTTNPSNYYAIKLFINGEWKIITTDDHFPFKEKTAIYAKPYKNDIWVMLLEKVWAKEFGSYMNIDFGYSTEGLMALTGAPYELQEIYQNQVKVNQIFKSIQDQHYVASLNSKQQLEKQGQNLGLSAKHTFTFLKKININGENLVQLHDPLGGTTWRGDWSFNCKKWTQQLRYLHKYNEDPKDGSFYISFSDLRKYFADIVICKINPFFVNNSIRAKTTPQQSAYFSMHIKKPGKYIVSIFQASKMKMKLQNKNYKYSQARIIILKNQGNEMIYVDSKFRSEHQLCSVEMELQEGEYVISTEVVWRQGQSSQIVLTSYGTEHVEFRPKDRSIAPKFMQYLIKSYVKRFSGQEQKNIYRLKQKGTDVTYEQNLNSKTGIGFVKIVNKKKKKSVEIEEKKFEGWKLIKSHPTLIMEPYQQRFYGYVCTS